MQTVNTHINLLDDLSKKGLLQRYCYFLKLKNQFVNTVYYKFTYRLLKRIHGISTPTISKLIKFFIKRGWCTINQGNLRFISLSKLCALEKVPIRRSVKVQLDLSNIKQCKLQLQKALFENNLRRQDFVIKVQNDLIKPTSLKVYKAAKRRERKLSGTTGESSGFLISTIQSLGNILSISKSAAQRVRKLFRCNHWYEFVRRFKLISRSISQYGYLRGIQPYQDKGVFYYKGSLYKNEPSMVIRCLAL